MHVAAVGPGATGVVLLRRRGSGLAATTATVLPMDVHVATERLRVGEPPLAEGALVVGRRRRPPRALAGRLRRAGLVEAAFHGEIS